MDHSQHDMHDHGHHVMPSDAYAIHDHAATGSISTEEASLVAATEITAIASADGAIPTNGHFHIHNMNEGGGGDATHMMQHMMSMAFHFGYEETILFNWWKIDSALGLIGSMAIIFLMAVFYEGLKYYREFLFWKTYNLLDYHPVTAPQRNNPEDPRRAAPSTTASPAQYVGEVMHKQPPTMFSLHHLYQTFLHILQVTISFLLMLIFMTYNVWLCMAVVLGAAVGYFLFCWKKSVIVDVTEHCH